MGRRSVRSRLGAADQADISRPEALRFHRSKRLRRAPKAARPRRTWYWGRTRISSRAPPPDLGVCGSSGPRDAPPMPCPRVPRSTILLISPCGAKAIPSTRAIELETHNRSRLRAGAPGARRYCRSFDRRPRYSGPAARRWANVPRGIHERSGDNLGRRSVVTCSLGGINPLTAWLLPAVAKRRQERRGLMLRLSRGGSPGQDFATQEASQLRPDGYWTLPSLWHTAPDAFASRLSGPVACRVTGQDVLFGGWLHVPSPT